VGALYAGLMLTADGPRVIEFNCRFGDPETQVIMPLLDSDILDIFVACADGHLANVDIRWKDGAAACVVLASGGYPGKYAGGIEINGLDSAPANAFTFHAGTKSLDGKTVTAGGRVLCVSGWGNSIREALDAAYGAVDPLSFEGIHYRKDIGQRAVVGEQE
jgi:phosphoribosylamine--glycine ligase